MKEFKIEIPVKEYSLEELPAEDRRLAEAARAMTRSSYAPYSQFHVGAAILLDNGEIVVGSNQENAAFSSGTCAERSACFYAGAQYPGVAMKKIAIAAWSDAGKEPGQPYEAYFQDEPIPPCGSCRQALLEYEHLYGPMELILCGREKAYVVSSVSELLPFSFTSF